jgi:hypothetical protein
MTVPLFAGALVATGHAAGFCTAKGLTPYWVTLTAVILIPAVTAAAVTPEISRVHQSALGLMLPTALALTIKKNNRGQSDRRQLLAMAVVAGWFALAAVAASDSEGTLITILTTAILWAMAMISAYRKAKPGAKFD